MSIELIWQDSEGRALPRNIHGKQFIRHLGGPCSLRDVQIKIKRIETVNVNHLRILVPRGFGRSEEDPTVLVQTRSQSRDSRSAAGVMSAVAYNREREVARSVLKVLPANFSEEEYQQMLEEIGSLALSSDSWVHANVSTEVSETGKGRSSDLSTKIQSLIDCVQVIEDKLPLLEASLTYSLIKPRWERKDSQVKSTSHQS